MKKIILIIFSVVLLGHLKAQTPADIAKKLSQKNQILQQPRDIQNACLDISQTTVTMSPEPAGCSLEPNTTYTWCATINNYNQPSANWLSGIVPVFGCAWDTTTLQPVGQLQTADQSGGTWVWTHNVQGQQTGAVAPSWGWYFDRNNDGDPGNNYGDAEQCCWNVCFSIKTIDLATAANTRPECLSTYNSGSAQLDASMSLLALSDEQIGSWDGSGACFGDGPAPTTGCHPVLNLCPTLSVSKTDARCTAPNGTAWINFPSNFSARDNFSFLWFTNPPQQGDTIEDLFPGTYNIVGSSSTGCEYELSVTIDDNIFSVTDTTFKTKCFNDSTGTAIVNLPATGGPFSVTWNTIPVSTNDTAKALPPGEYIYSVTDASTGCIIKDTVIVYTPEILNTFFEVDTNECKTANGAIVADVSGGNGNYQYWWTYANGDTIPSQNNNSIYNLTDGGYYLIVKDDSDCVRKFYTDVPKTDIPTADFLPVEAYEFLTDTNYFLIDQSLPGSGQLTNWWWEISNNGSSVHTATTPDIELYMFPDSGYYNIQLVVQNDYGCKDTLLRKHYVKKQDYDVEFPNIFTPNNDGSNDLLVFKNLEQYPENELLIYNRWGRKIYQKKPYLNDWNGDNQKDGTYYYIVKIPGYKNQEGFVTIVR